MQATTNAPYVDRIQLVLGSLTGPLTQTGPTGPLGDFDPRRDLEVYVDGKLTPVTTFAFDSENNRYLLYMAQAINLQGVIQVVHRIPSPPFADVLSIVVPGFAIIAGYSTLSDPYGWGLFWGDSWGAGVN